MKSTPNAGATSSLGHLRSFVIFVFFLTVAYLGAMRTAYADPGPALTVPESDLAAAAWCDPTLLPGTNRQAVLLIHGTGSTPDEAWGWGYQKALTADGFAVCTVTLPDRAVGNFTISAEYAVYAARYAYKLSGRKIAIIGHSQGAVIAAWIRPFEASVCSP